VSSSSSMTADSSSPENEYIFMTVFGNVYVRRDGY
jgi:hypothetical protein